MKHQSPSPTPPPELSGELGRLTGRASAVRRLTTRERGDLWSRLQRRGERAPRRSWMGLALGLTGAAAIVLALALVKGRRDGEVAGAATPGAGSPAAVGEGAALSDGPVTGLRGQTRTVHLGSRCDLFLSPDAEVTLPPRLDANSHGAYQVRLDRGRIAAVVGKRAPDEPLAVVTRHVRVSVVGTRFSVALEQEITAVAVEEGRVRVERGNQTVMLGAGDSIRSDDPRLAGGQAIAPEPCAAETAVEARRGCLARVAAGEGLLAENALYSLGLLERDRAHDPAAGLVRFREYERRFPRGVLAPEVALARAATLMLDGHVNQACAVAEAFGQRFPRDEATYHRLRTICGR